MPVCPICNRRAAKRSGPALRTKICAVCCARERMIELACPDSCTYLSDARTQMAAREVEWREREREAGIIRPELGQQWLAYLLMTQHAIVNAHRGIEGVQFKVGLRHNEKLKDHLLLAGGFLCPLLTR